MRDNALRLRIAQWLWGWVPHETQRQWLMSDARVKVAACGRRWGKTEAAAVDAAAMALLRPGSVQMIVSPTYDQSRLIFDTVERLVMSSPVTRAVSKVTRTPYPKLCVGDSTIMARTADDDGRNLRGHSADRVIVDEAAYVRDAVITEVISPMLADRNGQLVMVSTPFGKNAFYRAFLKGAESGERKVESLEGVCSRYASFQFPSWTNPHISAEYIEVQRAEISARQFAVEYEAQFLDDVSCVFSWEDILAASMRSRMPCEAEYIVAGIDWARYSDYTAVIVLAVREQELEVIAVDRFNAMAWQQQIERVVDFLRLHRVSAALADSTSIGDPLLDQLRNRLWETDANIAVDGYGFTNSSKRQLIEHLSLKFSHSSISIPNDERLLKELQYFEYELTNSGNVKMNARSGYHDDLVIALALAAWQAKATGGVGRVLAGGGRKAANFGF